MSDDEKKLKNLATEFIEEMLNTREKLNGRKIEIERQHKNIDVLLKIKNKEDTEETDCYVIIEDKIVTGLHSNQLEKYKDIITKEIKEKEEEIPEDKIKTVYYKIWDEDGIENIGADVIFTRKKYWIYLKNIKI